MFHIVKHKSSNAHDIRGIFMYLFLKSLTGKIDLYIILYTEQKSEHSRENYSSIVNGCSNQTNEFIFFLSSVHMWRDLLPFYQKSRVPNMLSSSFPCD